MDSTSDFYISDYLSDSGVGFGNSKYLGSAEVN